MDVTALEHQLRFQGKKKGGGTMDARRSVTWSVSSRHVYDDVTYVYDDVTYMDARRSVTWSVSSKHSTKSVYDFKALN